MNKLAMIDYSNDELCINKESLFEKVPKLTLFELKQIKKFLTGEVCNYTTEFDNNRDILVINMSNYTAELDNNKIQVISTGNYKVPINHNEVKELVIDFNNDSSRNYFIKHCAAEHILKKIDSKQKKLTIWNEEIVGWFPQKKHDMQSLKMVFHLYPILKILEFTCCNSIEVTGGIFFLEELIFINCSYIHIDDSDFEFKRLKTIILFNCDEIILNLQMKKLNTLKIFNSTNTKFKKNDIVIENLIIDNSVDTAKLPLANTTQIINNILA